MVATFVLNSRSQKSLFFSFFTTHVSPSSSTILPNRIPLAYILGIVTMYSAVDSKFQQACVFRTHAPPSSGAPKSVILFSPSMVVETLLPRNLDFGLSSPTMYMRFAGEI